MPVSVFWQQVLEFFIWDSSVVKTIVLWHQLLALHQVYYGPWSFDTNVFFFFSHRHTWRDYAEAHVTWHMSCQHWSITYLVKSQISALCRNHISFLILNIILKHFHICWKLLHLDNVLWNLIEVKKQTSWLTNTYKLPGTE